MHSVSANRITVGEENAVPIEIFYKDWGMGRPIVFCHAWPLNADAWDEQLVFFAERGYRVIAPDRRGHGRSSQPWGGYDMDTFADDLAKVIETLDLKDAVLVGHSMAGGEVVRYLARHGSARVSGAVLVGAIPPLLLQTEANPHGAPKTIFDGIRAAVAADRSQFFYDVTQAFYNYNRPGAKVSEGVREAFRIQGLQMGLKAALDCIAVFSETDFTEDLAKIDVPVLILHGEDDQLAPAEVTGMAAAKILKNATLKTYPGGSHAPQVTERDQFHADLLAFLQS